MKLVKNWKPVIDKFISKLTEWKSKSLSFGRRLTLLKSVLENLPTYYLCLFVAPLSVIEAMEKIRRHFLWGGWEESNRKIHWTLWEKVTTPKELGGLGVITLKSFNISLIVKWWWRLRQSPTSYWVKTITGIHKLSARAENCLSNKALPGVWNNIANVSKELIKHNISLNQVPTRKSTPYGSSWICELTSDGRYATCALRNKLTNHQPVDSSKFTWVKDFPIKFVCFIWQAKMGSIPSAEALSNRGVTIDSKFCKYCGDESV
uniref:Reverse transcriptase zinc-binding domain-containing protein n=1 Tax=Lactuca sativa TaxID=4236 RepID=A0A9R1WJF3_LACSA|nr:hypothetical protein LSAT_V11C100021160 [Lactuca sativa]